MPKINKKIKIIIIILITILVSLMSYMQVFPLIIKKPQDDFQPIEISEAKDIPDINIVLSFLYNITKCKHPTGSSEIYKVRDYIVSCLEEFDVEYEIQTINLDEVFFGKIKNRDYQKLLELKKESLEDIKQNIGNEEVSQFIQENTSYKSFDEFYINEICGGKDIEKILQDNYEEKVNQYKNQTLNNILVKLNSTGISSTRNILLVTHYDSISDSYGAGDAGMNVAGLLETIRCIKENNFKNNIHILFTDGEEENFWGASEFIENNKVNYDLVINFDNSGNSGKFNLYHYSNSSLVKAYLNSVKNESLYSFSNDILFNPKSNYYTECSDAFEFIKNGYNTIDFALVGNSSNYHSENDNFYNIDINSLGEITRSMISIAEYFGNNNIELEKNEELLFFTLMNGIVFSVNKTIYYLVSIILITINLIYIFVLFKKHENIAKKIFIIIIDILAILALFLFLNFSMLIAIPGVIDFALDYIKNRKIKEFLKISCWEIYLFIILQPIFLVMQYIMWSVN